MNYDEKYYRVCAYVDLDAIHKNAENLKANTAEGTMITAVIKTDGYGHGAVPIAHKLEDIVYSYAVATIEEALNLRKHQVEKPIYILGYTHESAYPDAIENEIRLAVFEFESASLLSKAALKAGKSAKIHIKVDTGMSRIGFADNDESVEVIKRISELPMLEIEGIFTHFARADEIDKTSSDRQFERFRSFISKLEKESVYIPIKHCSNSAGIIDIRKANMTSVRAGISLYGMYPSNEVDINAVKLYDVLTLKSHVTYVKEVGAGVGISYGSTYVTQGTTKIATIPVGYGDGYPRSLSNKGYVLINGQKANVLGRVCMDQFMVDVSEIPNVKSGDEVILIGKQGKNVITVDHLAKLSGRFNYEFVCDLGKRIPRVYIEGEKPVSSKDYFYDKY